VTALVRQKSAGEKVVRCWKETMWTGGILEGERMLMLVELEVTLVKEKL
jgi:hypothetical protein